MKCQYLLKKQYEKTNFDFSEYSGHLYTDNMSVSTDVRWKNKMIYGSGHSVEDNRYAYGFQFLIHD